MAAVENLPNELNNKPTELTTVAKLLRSSFLPEALKAYNDNYAYNGDSDWSDSEPESISVNTHPVRQTKTDPLKSAGKDFIKSDKRTDVEEIVDINPQQLVHDFLETRRLQTMPTTTGRLENTNADEHVSKFQLMDKCIYSMDGGRKDEGDWKVLQNIFPDELWMEILGKIDVESKKVASNASPFFRHLLLPTMPKFLFPCVWKVLAGRCEAYHYNSEDSENDHNFPYLPCKPWFHHILTLRLVCKDWNYGVRDFYENQSRLFSMDDSVIQARVDIGLDSEEERQQNIDFTKELAVWTDYRFKTPYQWRLDKLSLFMKHFAATHGPDLNPFLSRSIVFDATEIENDFNEAESSYLSKITELLTKYGRHIWFCTFDNFPVVLSPLAYFTYILQWLTLMPNLKVLKFVLGSFYGDNLLNEEQINEVNLHLEANRIPSLQDLQFVSFYATPEVFSSAFLQQNRHIQKLEFLEGEKVDLNDFRFPNLKHFSYVADFFEDYEMLESCLEPWALETLYLDIVADDFPDMPMERFFRFFERWENSLTDAMLGLPKAIKAPEDSEYIDVQMGLELPKVMRFRVEIPDLSSMDFILPMGALQVLEIGIERSSRWPGNLKGSRKHHWERFETHVYCAQWNKDVYKCNIWELFPQLKRIRTKESCLEYWMQSANYVRRNCESINSNVVSVRASI